MDNELRMEETNKYAIPIAIMVAGALIAGALYLTNRQEGGSVTQSKETRNVPGVSSEDHILGNPNAKVVIVEYSDLECPFCKEFHTTMHAIINEYGATGNVAWVYRHFPIAQLHSKAAKESEAAECAAELGGNQAFWKYIDRVYEITPSNNGLDPASLSTVATEIGLTASDFTSCLESGRYTEKVQTQYKEIVAAGGRGTPHNIVIVNGEQAPIEGAQPLVAMRKVIETLLDGSGNVGVPVVPTR